VPETGNPIRTASPRTLIARFQLTIRVYRADMTRIVVRCDGAAAAAASCVSMPQPPKAGFGELERMSLDSVSALVY
jgi:hypothetical protein